MTESGNGQLVNVLVELMQAVQAEVKVLREEHADYRTGAERRGAQLERLTKTMDDLSKAVVELAHRLDGVESRTGWLPTSDRALGYGGVAVGGGLAGAALHALFGI